MKASQLFDMSGAVAIVAGASGTLGRQFSIALAEAGAAIALVGRNREGLEATRQAVSKTGAKAAIVTLGEMGALYHTRGRSELVPAFKVAPVVETTGAGDAFNGGFAAALARGMDPLDAVRFGCAVAGISVTRPGTAPSMPNLTEVEQVLKAK